MISCTTVTASSDTLGVHSHAADEGGQLAWSALAHPRLSSRARTDPRPQLQLLHARSVIQHATNSSWSAKPGLLLSASFRCVSAMGRCVVVPCAGERLDGGFYVRGSRRSELRRRQCRACVGEGAGPGVGRSACPWTRPPTRLTSPPNSPAGQHACACRISTNWRSAGWGPAGDHTPCAWSNFAHVPLFWRTA